MDKRSYYNRCLKNISTIKIGEHYMCPLCMMPFENMTGLTEEDVPQKSLGGKRITLTCKRCNNTCGSDIDIHLLGLIKGITQQSFIPGSDRKVSVLKGEKRLNATLKVEENRELLLTVDTKRNNPKIWELFHNEILLENSVVNIKDNPLKQDIRRYSAAILKNAYLILFERTGYTFLSDPYYNKLRQQIMSPDPYILPERLWTIQDVSVPDGIYLTRDNKYRGFLVFYSLKWLQTFRVCALIPTPKVEYYAACKELMKICNKSRIQVMRLPDEDFLCNEKSIIKLKNWCYGWNLDM